MLLLEKKNKGITIIDCWYATEPLKEKGVIRYFQAVKPLGKHQHEFLTLITDLTESEEEIMIHFSKSCKYKVKRAVREGVEVVLKASEEITNGDLDDFADFYLEFYNSKGYEEVNRFKLINELKMYREKKALSISMATANGTAVVYHTHIVEKTYARLFHSASLYRIEETIPSTVVGMANRFLHKEDMLFFKDMGIQKYDWGGAGIGEEVANITEFKESFGGEHATFFHGEEVIGLKAKLYHFVVGVIGKVTK